MIENEAEKTAEFERACGSVDKAFRLLRLYRDTSEPSAYERLYKAPSKREKFIKRATSEGYSKRAINLFFQLQD